MNTRYCFVVVLLLSQIFLLGSGKCLSHPPEVTASNQTASKTHPIETHVLTSDYQSGKTRLRVIAPRIVDSNKKYPVLFVLPVEAAETTTWGDPAKEIVARNVANLHQVICVIPSFSHLPWYCDHPNDPAIRQETYLLKAVLPFIEEHYPIAANQRFLIGYSKSGWGALTLLLRHPNVFQAAAIFDAPLMMDHPNQYGARPIFGSQQNFEKYKVTALLQECDASFHQQNRLTLVGRGNFADHHEAAHQLLNERKIKHTNIASPKRKHSWHSGWVEVAAKQLFATVDTNQGDGESK